MYAVFTAVTVNCDSGVRVASKGGDDADVEEGKRHSGFRSGGSAPQTSQQPIREGQGDPGAKKPH